MKRVVYHRLAASELIKAGVFYEKRRPGLGNAFLAAVDEARDRIRRNPARGRPEVASLRSLNVRRFPYRLFYDDQPEQLWIVAVAHLARRPGYWVRRAQ
jgi:toxin ParE1/3/4